MTEAVHTPADLMRYWNHPEVAKLRQEAHRVNIEAKTCAERGRTMTAPLNAIRDKITELKALEA